jgi:conjugal transfer pilus assembly protein TraW
MSKRHVLNIAAVAVVIASGVGAGSARAEDLGTHGATFAIAEQDILQVIAAKLRLAEAGGRIERMQQEFQRRVRARVERPQAAPGVRTTVEPRSWLFDPSIVVPRDFADHRGRVFARAGSRVNPLQRMPDYDRVMLFIDGDDARQVDWAIGQMREHGEHRTRMVLTKGAPLELMRSRRVQFFFDQEAKLVTHFQIRQVPARITKEGERLRIEELNP